DESSVQFVPFFKNHQGTIGGEIFKRFTCYIDYPNRKIYLKKNRNYKDDFYVNMSGLEIKYVGKEWTPEKIYVHLSPTEQKEQTPRSMGKKITQPGYQIRYNFRLRPIYAVATSREGSPAYEAGIRKGDRVLWVNGKKAGEYTLAKLNQLFGSREGRTIKMVVSREEQEHTYKFKLRDPLPVE